MAQRRLPTRELLETRRLLTAFGFALHDIGSAQAAALPSMILADLDGDNDLDMLSDNVWRPNDGSGQFGQTQLLFSKQTVDGLFAADLDADGDLDLAVTGRANTFDTATIVTWYENLNGLGLLSAPHPIDRVLGKRGSAVTGGDLDGDGDIDLVETVNGVVKVYGNSDGRGTFVESLTWHTAYSFVTLYDVDADNDLDVVASGAGGMDLLENQAGDFVTHHLLNDSGLLAIQDVNRDGILDFLFAGHDNSQIRILWYEFRSSPFSLSKHQTLVSIASDGIMQLALGDVDGDGDADLSAVLSRDSANANYNIVFNELVESTYGAMQRIAGEEGPSNHSGLALADLDGNGTAELVYVNAVAFYDAAAGQFGAPQVFAPASRQENGRAILADIDGDGDDDVIASDATDYCFAAYGACTTQVVWYENINGQGEFIFRKRIWSEKTKFAFLGLGALEAADIDGDGDLDIVLDNSYVVSKLVWLENRDGQGDFGPAQPYGDGPLIDIVDLDGDGRADVLTSENSEVNVSFDLAHPNSSSLKLAGRVEAFQPENAVVDWDSDGDADVVLLQNNEYVWHENLGKRTFLTSQFIIEKDSLSFFNYQFGDVDGDGDRDALWTTQDREVVWQEARNGGSWGPVQSIATQGLLWNVADLDGNEVVDCFIVPTGKSDAKVYLNDGDGHFHDGTIVLPTRSTVWTDLDHDGDLDLFDSYARVWYERRTLGDANADGRFDSADIVALFQAGQYEDWLAKNSIFQTGDFNADGEFDSADLVYAFAYGVYVA